MNSATQVTTAPILEQCGTCWGYGVVERFGDSQIPGSLPCPSCHGSGWRYVEHNIKPEVRHASA